jgi:hypothetical protein
MAADEIVIPEIHKVQIEQETAHERALSWGRSTSVIDDDVAAPAIVPAADAVPTEPQPAGAACG